MKMLNYEGALCIEPATQEDLISCNEELLELEIPQMPDDYAEFLKIVNGYAWNGYEFYGTMGVEVVETGYYLPDIGTENLEFQERYDIQEKLLLGCWDISYYTYNPQTKKYEELDSDSPSPDVMKEFDTFEQLLKECVLNIA